MLNNFDAFAMSEELVLKGRPPCPNLSMPTIIRSFVESCFCWIIINNVKLSSRTILGQAIRGLPRKIVFVPHVIDDQKTHIGRQEIDCIGPYMGNGICKVHHWYHHHNMGRVALPNRMNFLKNSKWPSTCPLGKLY